MKQRLSRAASARLAIVLAIAAAAPLTLAPALATGATESTDPATTVFIKDGRGGLRFEGPKTIVSGEELTVLNMTNARHVGPHTFSLVTKGSIPKTPKARQICFTPKHICRAIAGWHGVKGNGPLTVNPVDVGLEGWDTMGSLTKTGDSWFTGHRPSASITQKVSAAAGTTIYFMCAIHPWMHGSIEVVAPPTP